MVCIPRIDYIKKITVSPIALAMCGTECAVQTVSVVRAVVR